MPPAMVNELFKVVFCESLTYFFYNSGNADEAIMNQVEKIHKEVGLVNFMLVNVQTKLI